MKKIVVCPDSFKGSLTAAEVSSAISTCIKKLMPDVEIIKLPLADGGEGSLEILQKTLFPKRIHVTTVDPLLRAVESYFLTDKTGKYAFIESASTIGLPLLKQKERNPLLTSSFGLGLLILKAYDYGCENITVSLGGSATNDGGIGALYALGYKFYDKEGLLPYPKGIDLKSIQKIDTSSFVGEIKKLKFTVLCDVVNPLLGDKGATKIFAGQKGAGIKEIDILERGLKNLVEVASAQGYKAKNIADYPGSGAAGGLGFAFRCFLDAQIINGFDFIADTLDLDSKIADADLIITGEGKIDSQSLMGKVIGGVIERAGKYNIPVIGIGGKVEDQELLLRAGMAEVIEIADPDTSLQQNMEKETAIKNIEAKISASLSSFDQN